jgi:phosphopentomutase
MRKLAAAAIILAVAACAKKEAAPDTTAAAVATPAAPAPLTDAAIAGTWEAEGRPMDKDTVVVRFTMNNTDTGAGTSVTFPSGEKVMSTSRQISGDSVVSTSGAFKSQVRKGMRVMSTRMVMRMQDGKLVGTSMSKYSNGDSATFRITATKKP